MLQEEKVARKEFALFYMCNTSFFGKIHSHPHFSRTIWQQYFYLVALAE
ncbi:phosphotransacetylase [Bacillus toyonensis]|nr:phosphotransacetylase [Bacillus toyonensis]QEQ19897.1 phosphotransacetylase [Bacillus sp. BS98]